MRTRSKRQPGRPYDDDADAFSPDTEPDTTTGPGTDPQPEPSSARQAGTRPPVRMCVRCQVTTEAPVVVCTVHQNSGPGFTVYACQACAQHFPPQDVPTRAGDER